MDYYVMIKGQRVGPLPEEEVRKRIGCGEVDGQTPVWHDGLEKWKPCGEVLQGVPQPDVWFAMVNGQRLGPLHRGALERAVALGQVTAETKVWKPGMPKWRSWGKLAEEEGVKVDVLDPSNLQGSLHAAVAATSGSSAELFDFEGGGKTGGGKGVFNALIGRILPARKNN